MPETKKRKFKILGAAWLGLGGIAFALALIAFLSVVLGDDPGAAAFESGDKWWIVVLVLFVVGAIFSVNGLALLRRDPKARPLIAISSLFLVVPSVAGVAAGGIGVPALLVVAPSLWLTLSRGGKKAFEGYMARENG